jgi:hypothetical protein
LPRDIADLKADGCQVIGERDAVKRETVGGMVGFGGAGKRRSETGVIESRLAGAAFGMDKDELPGAIAQIVAIPEPGIVVEPVRGDAFFEDQIAAAVSAIRGLWGRLLMPGGIFEGSRLACRGDEEGGHENHERELEPVVGGSVVHGRGNTGCDGGPMACHCE